VGVFSEHTVQCSKADLKLCKL